MSDGEAILSIKADVKDATAKLKQVQAANERLSSSLKKVQNRTTRTTKETVDYVAKLGLAAGAVQGVVGKLDEWSRKAVQVRTVNANLAFSIEDARKATGGLVDNMTLMTSANAAAQLGVTKNSKEFANLTKVATKLGSVVGKDAKSSVEDFTTALARQSPMILDNLGLSLKVGEANERYAARLGKTADELTDAERKQAFMTEAMALAEAKAKDIEVSFDDAASGVQRFSVMLANARDDVFRLDELVVDLGRELNAAFGPEVYDTNQTAMENYFSALTFGLDEAIGKWAEYNLRAAQGIAYTSGDNVKAAALRALETIPTAEDRGGVSFLNEEEERARQDAEFADRMIAGGVGDAWAEFAAGAPVQEEKPKTGGRRRAPQRIAENRDFNADFSNVAAAESQRISAELEQQRIEDRLQLENAANDTRIANIEREIEMQGVLAQTDLERFEAQQIAFEREQEIYSIKQEQAANDLILAENEAERIAATEELSQARHEAELARIQQEQSAKEWADQQEAKRLETRRKIAETTVDITRSSVGAMGQIWSQHAEQRGASEKVLFNIQRGIEVADLSLRSISYGIKSAAAFAAQNYFAGATNAAAAAIAAAGAISTLALTPDSARSNAGAGGGGGSMGGGITTPLQPVGGTNDSSIPASQAGSPVDPGSPRTGRGAAGGAISIGQIQVLGAVDDDTAEKIAIAIDDVRADGRALGA